MPVILKTKDVDVLAVGWTYLHFFGDVPKTAVHSGVSPMVVEQLAREHDWDSQLQEVRSIRADETETDAKARNRTVNFLQAQRLRSIVDRVVSHLHEADDKTFASFFETTDRKGNVIPNSKALTDLTKAAETVHQLTYAALGDTRAAEKAGDNRVGEIGLAVANALNATLDKIPTPPKPVDV